MGLTLFMCIAIFGPICGGHFNPAVTLAVFIREYDLKNAVFMSKIIVAQFLGAIFGTYIIWLI